MGFEPLKIETPAWPIIRTPGFLTTPPSSPKNWNHQTENLLNEDIDCDRLKIPDAGFCSIRQTIIDNKSLFEDYSYYRAPHYGTTPPTARIDFLHSTADNHKNQINDFPLVQDHQSEHLETSGYAHLSVGNVKKQQGWICYICCASFPAELSWKNHMARTHKEKPFQCDQCPKTYRYLGNLKEHHQSEHSNDKVRYPCNLCGREFKMNSSMVNHVVCHLKYKHKCNVCGWAYHTNRDMSVHKKTTCKGRADEHPPTDPPVQTSKHYIESPLLHHLLVNFP